MTSNLAVRLIEQFAAQAPFAILIADARGVVIFANKKLHETLGIPDHPSKALGINLFTDPAIEALHLAEAARHAKEGELIDLVVDIPAPDRLESDIEMLRKEPITLKVSCYSLRSSAQTIEHYVMAMTDVSETYGQRAALRAHLRDLKIFNTSREGRLSRLAALKAQVEALEAEIVRAGATPVDPT